MLGERAPAWELNEAGRQVGVLAGPEYSGQAGQDPSEDWNWTQNEGQQVDNNLLDDNLMNEIELLFGLLLSSFISLLGCVGLLRLVFFLCGALAACCRP